MALSDGALTTVAKVLRYMGVGIESSVILSPALDVYNDESVGSAATVEVTAATMVLIVTGGATTTLTFADADTNLMGELVTKINAIAGGDWIATLQGDLAAESTLLATIPPTNAFGVEDELNLSYYPNELIERVIEAASDQIEAWCGHAFASQSYSEIDPFSRTNGIVQLGQINVSAVDFFSTETEDALTIQYTGTDPIATVEVRGDSVVLRSRAEDGATETTKTFTDATDDTLTELAATITLVADWTASVRNTGPSQYLDVQPARDATSQVTLEAWVPFDDQYILHPVAGYLEVPFGCSSAPGGRYRCDYTAGDSTVPYDIEQVAIELASEMLKAAGTDTNFKSERLGDYAYQLASGSERKEQWMARLQPRVRMVL